MAEDPTPELTSFTAGDLVISISGDGNDSGTYTDNEASPITLDEITTSGSVVGQLVLPQTTTVVNGTTEYAISGEYGSSSEGSLQLSADGRSLVIAGYGVNANAFNAGGASVYGNSALGQSTSLTTTKFTPVARVIADIGFNGTVDTSTALYNVFNTNNPRSVATVNGTSFYIAGQGVSGDTTQGLFVAEDGANSATAINTSTDMRTAEIVNGVLYVSTDSKQGSGGTSDIASYGGLPTGAATPTALAGIDGTVTLTAGQENGINDQDVGQTVHLSPENFFFANSDTLYVADGGNPKAGGLGDGGLQKWSLVDGSWKLDYTLATGLDLVADSGTSGTTGLIGLTGEVVDGGSEVAFFATNATIGDTDQTYVYTITDNLAATSATQVTGETFSAVMSAAPDTNIRGISFAPQAGTVTSANVTVSANVISTGLTVGSGSTVTVLSGGNLEDSTILSGGSATIAVGGEDSGTTIGQGGFETVSGAAANEDVEGTQLVSAATAAVSNEIVFNGGQIDLFLKGATADGIVVENGGELLLSGNVVATDVMISSGGIVNLQSPKANVDGTLTFAGSGTLEETAAVSSGFGVSATISGFGAGDVIDLTAIGTGATFSATTSGGNTIATVTSGKFVESFTFVGSALASELKMVNDTTSGVELIVSAPVVSSSGLTVSTGATSTGLTVSANETLTVQSGGAIVNTIVQSGGTVLMSGTDTGAVISAGGNETVFGSATGDQVFGTQLVSDATAVVSNETVFNGGAVELFLKGAVSDNVTVSSGGELLISGNATAENTTLMDGGLLQLQSPKADVTGSLTFSGAATLQDTDTMSAGFGVTAVISGFGAGDVIDLTTIAPGATFSTSVVSGNTVAVVSGGGVTESFTFAGSTIGASLVLSDDATGGVEITSGAPVTSGTFLTVSSGVTSTGLTVSAHETLTVQTSGAIVDTVIQSGGLALVDGTDTDAVISAGGNETIFGSATGDQIFGTQLVSAATAVVSSETVFSGGALDLFLKGAVSNDITVSNGGELAINGNATANDTVLMSGGLLELESPKAVVAGSLTFSGPATLQDTATMSAGFGVSAIISGFGAGDTIDLTTMSGGTLSSTTSGGDQVESVTANGVTDTFTFAGNFTNEFFHLSPDSLGGVMLTVNATPCYCPGTLILTDKGEVPVEALRIGDQVVTHAGAVRPIRWIGHRAYDGRFIAGHRDVLPVRIAAGALADGMPRRDLTVSPLHAIFIDGMLIPAAALVNGVSIVQLEAVETVEYFHVELETHDVLMAEGAPAESFVDDEGRNAFHNAADYAALYPDAVRKPAEYCAPRLEEGEALEAIRARLAARAMQSARGPLDGVIDVASRGRIAGWARDILSPDQPVRLQVIANDVVLCEVVADQYRADLAEAFIGDGRHAFDVTIPGGLAPGADHVIRVRRADDGAALPERRCA